MSNIGLKRGTVKVVPYTEDWAREFELEKQRLIKAFGEHEIVHVGSTSIPGMSSKPIIDMMMIVSDTHDLTPYKEKLESMGYTYRGPQGEIERELFVKGPEESRTHHLNLTRKDTEFYKDHLQFLNYLRANSNKADEYAKLKEELAEKFVNDRESYTKGKKELIERFLKEAGYGS